MILQPGTLNAIRVARVCHVHPEGHAFDGVFCDSGDYCRNVQVMTHMAGTDFGFSSGIPAPEKEGWDENRELDPDKRDVLAVVTTCSTGLLCLGFLYPQVNHMSFPKDGHKNRMIERHPSDAYRTIDDDANMELVHPANAHVLISQSQSPTALEGRDYDKRWEIKRNKNKEVTISIVNQSKKTTYVKLFPSGDITIYADNNINITAGNKVIITAGTEIKATAPIINLN